MSLRWGPTLLVLLAGTLAFSTVPAFELVWDDVPLLATNARLAQGSLVGLLLGDFAPEGPGSGYYRPLVTLTFYLEGLLFGTHPAGFHAMNVVYHLAAALAVAWAGARVLPSGAAWLAAVFFAVHPIHTESVSFVSGRTDVLAAGLLLAAFALHTAPGDRRAWRSALALAAYALALCAKEVALALPLVLAAWELARRPVALRTAASAAARRLWPYVAVTAGYGALRLAAVGLPQSPTLEGGPLGRVRLTLEVLPGYLGLLVWPYPPNPDRVLDPSGGWGLAAVGAAALVALGGAAAAAWRASRLPAFLVGWFLLTLLPALPLVPVTRPQMAERFLYLPSVALVWAMGWGGQRLIEHARARASRRRPAVAVLGLVVALGLGLTLVRSEDWRTGEALFLRMVEASPGSWRASLNLGYLYLDRGDLARARRHLNRTLALRPGRPSALMGLGLVESRAGNHAAALALGERARAADPSSERFAMQMGVIHGQAGDHAAAAGQFAEAIGLAPGHPEARYLLALALARAGRGAEARAALDEADVVLGSLRQDVAAWRLMARDTREQVARGASP